MDMLIISLVLLIQADSQTVLLEAAARGDEAAVEQSVDAGVTLESRDEDGHTPLILAAAGGHRRVVKTLLQAGAKPNVTGSDGWPALAHAEAQGHTEIVDLLLDNGAQWRDVPPIAGDADLESLADAWDTDPVPLEMPRQPSYSKKAYEMRISGDVILEVKVLTDGSTELLKVLKPVLYCTDRAKEHARKWKWQPAERDGKPVEAIGVISVSFEIWQER